MVMDDEEFGFPEEPAGPVLPNWYDPDPRLTIGKHQGVPLADVPTDYLFWALQTWRGSDNPVIKANQQLAEDEFQTRHEAARRREERREYA